MTQHCKVRDTDAFDIVNGTDFLRGNPQVKLLSLHRPYAPHCDLGCGLFSVPLELSGRKESGLPYVNRSYRTENYQLVRPVLESGLAALQVDLNEVQVESFASKEQHMRQLYCSRYLNNAYRFYGRSMELCYANPAFSKLAKVLTKIALEGVRVILCTPDWGTRGEQAYWRRPLDHMTVGRSESPNGSIYVPEDSQETMPAPEWGSFLSIVDGSLNPVPVSDLNQVVLKELMAENQGLTPWMSKKAAEPPQHHPPTGHRPRVTRAPLYRGPQHIAATRAHRGTQRPGRHRPRAHLKPTRSPTPGQQPPSRPSAQPTGGRRPADTPTTKNLSTPSWSPAGAPPTLTCRQLPCAATRSHEATIQGLHRGP